MGWKQYVRSTQAAVRRSERAALRRHRELQREYERQAKASQRHKAADEVNQFESYLALLTTVHADCGEVWDWHALARISPPVEPARSSDRENHARAALEGYQPGFFDRLFGGAKKTRTELERGIEEAVAMDQRAHDAAIDRYRQQFAHWNMNVHIAPGVLRFDLDASRRALNHVGAFDELQALKTSVLLESVTPQDARLTCRIEDADIVPKEELRLTAGGKVSTKDMPLGKYWALFRDHVCSCAIRIARETFAALPVSGVTVHVQVVRLDPSSGFVGPATILGVQFNRVTLAGLNLDAINPSASLTHFRHRMSFKKSSGFQTIDAMSDEFMGSASEVDFETGGVEVDFESGGVELEDGREQQIQSGGLVDLDDGDDVDDSDAGDAAQQFLAWTTEHMAGRVSANFKIKTLVNQLGHYRADRRLSLKAVQDLANVLADAGFELDPDPRTATRSPGIDARVKLIRTLTAEENRAAAYRDAVRAVALWRFLWGAGLRRLYLNSSSGRPRPDDRSVETVQELLLAVQTDSERNLAILKTLVATGALEYWLAEAQCNTGLAELRRLRELTHPAREK